MQQVRSFPISIDFPERKTHKGAPHTRISDELMLEIMSGVLAGLRRLTEEARRRVRSIKVKLHTYGFEGIVAEAAEGVERIDYELRLTFYPGDLRHEYKDSNVLVFNERLSYQDIQPNERTQDLIAEFLYDLVNEGLEGHLAELREESGNLMACVNASSASA